VDSFCDMPLIFVAFATYFLWHLPLFFGGIFRTFLS
jgi:hypothetical protein